MFIITKSAEETIKFGEQIGRKVLGTPIKAIFLYGEMGAGKTHFVKGLARGMGITAHVTSPTFAIVNEYGGGDTPADKLFHFDLFRITSFDDLYAIGFYDYIDRGVIVCEWSENIPELEREFEAFYKVEISKISEHEREINVHTRT
jgi:tRNA threonylcarbamoyladenosine biosynthesis protein TsaE